MANTKITTAVIKDDAITPAKIADDAVTGALIADDVALAGNPTTTTQSAGNNTTRIATTAFVTTAINNLVDSAPSALDTLNELAAAMGDDANFSTTVTNSIATKLPLAGGTLTGNLVVSTTSPQIQFQTSSSHYNWQIAAQENVSGAFEISSGAQDADATNDTYTPRLVVDNNGNVGIGVTIPTNYYSQFDNLVVGASGANGITVVSGTSHSGTVAFADGTSGNAAYRGFVQYDHNADSLLLGSVGATAVTIDLNSDVTFAAQLTIPEKIIHTADADTFLQFNANDTFRIVTGDEERFRVSNGEVVVNENSQDTDFRVESDVSTHGIFLQASNGRVGIGTSAPANPLVVKDGTNVDCELLSETNGVGMQSYNRTSSAYGYIRFNSATSGGETMRLDTSGNVGIGSSSIPSDYRLELQKSDYAALLLSNTSTSIADHGTVGFIDFAAGSSRTVVGRVSVVADGTSENGGELVVETRVAGGSLTEKMRIDGAGGVIFNESNQHFGTSPAASADGEFVHFNTGKTQVSSGTTVNVNLFERKSIDSSCAGTVYIACENSGENVNWSYILDFFFSNNTFTTTVRADGNSQSTTTVTLSENQQAIRLAVAYAGGLGGNIEFNAGGHASLLQHT